MPGATTRPQQIGPTRFLPTPLVFPETQGVIGYNDIDPRFGVAYDLFGNGKTALKFNLGRYLEAAVGDNGNYSSLQPVQRIVDQRHPDRGPMPTGTSPLTAIC